MAHIQSLCFLCLLKVDMVSNNDELPPVLNFYELGKELLREPIVFY